MYHIERQKQINSEN